MHRLVIALVNDDDILFGKLRDAFTTYNQNGSRLLECDRDNLAGVQQLLGRTHDWAVQRGIENIRPKDFGGWQRLKRELEKIYWGEDQEE